MLSVLFLEIRDVRQSIRMNLRSLRHFDCILLLIILNLPFAFAAHYQSLETPFSASEFSIRARCFPDEILFDVLSFELPFRGSLHAQCGANDCTNCFAYGGKDDQTTCLKISFNLVDAVRCGLKFNETFVSAKVRVSKHQRLSLKEDRFEIVHCAFSNMHSNDSNESLHLSLDLEQERGLMRKTLNLPFGTLYFVELGASYILTAKALGSNDTEPLQIDLLTQRYFCKLSSSSGIEIAANFELGSNHNEKLLPIEPFQFSDNGTSAKALISEMFNLEVGSPMLLTCSFVVIPISALDYFDKAVTRLLAFTTKTESDNGQNVSGANQTEKDEIETSKITASIIMLVQAPEISDDTNFTEQSFSTPELVCVQISGRELVVGALILSTFILFIFICLVCQMLRHRRRRQKPNDEKTVVPSQVLQSQSTLVSSIYGYGGGGGGEGNANGNNCIRNIPDKNSCNNFWENDSFSSPMEEVVASFVHQQRASYCAATNSQDRTYQQQQHFFAQQPYATVRERIRCASTHLPLASILEQQNNISTAAHFRQIEPRHSKRLSAISCINPAAPSSPAITISSGSGSTFLPRSIQPPTLPLRSFQQDDDEVSPSRKSSNFSSETSEAESTVLPTSTINLTSSGGPADRSTESSVHSAPIYAAASMHEHFVCGSNSENSPEIDNIPRKESECVSFL